MDNNIVLEDLHPTYQLLSKLIGLEAALKLGREFARSTMYFPAPQALTESRRNARDKRIYEDYESGRFTKGQLGRRYKLSAVGINSALKRAKSRKDPSQRSKDSVRDRIFQEVLGLPEEERYRVLKYAIRRKSLSK